MIKIASFFGNITSSSSKTKVIREIPLDED